jgi:hypothetical protein
MTAIDFDEADLAEGRLLVTTLDGSQWALGDLAIRVAGPGAQTHAHDGSTAKLSFFADAIGIHHEQLARYRSVASAWPPDTRVPGASWTLHRTLAPLPADDRRTILVEFIAACELGGTRPTRDRLLSKLRSKPILPDDEPSTVPSQVACATETPPETVKVEPQPREPEPEPDPGDYIGIDAPEWMTTELARIRINNDKPQTSTRVALTVNEAMGQFHELEAKVAALNEYRRSLLFAIVSQRPAWWPALEPKLAVMDAEEQWLLDELDAAGNE